MNGTSAERHALLVVFSIEGGPSVFAEEALFDCEFPPTLGTKQIDEEKAWNCRQSRLISEVC